MSVLKSPPEPTLTAAAAAPPATGSSQRFTQGWVIIAFTFAMQFFSVGIGYYTFGVYLKPLAAALDADRFLISLGLSIQTIVTAVFSPFVGKLLADRSLKLLMATGTVVMAIGLLLLSQATQLWHLYVAFGMVITVGMVLTGSLPTNMVLANWFVRRRGTALGISQFGVTISATVLVPTVTWLVLTYGWRTSLVVSAIGTCVLLLPLIAKFAVKSPEELGLHPDGVSEPATGAVVGDANDPIPAEEWTFLRTLRERDVWLLTLIVGPCFMAIAAVVLSLPAHGTDLGLSPMRAASVVAFTTLFGAIAKPLFGILSDHFNKRLVVAVALACQIVGLTLFIFGERYIELVAAGSVFGLGYGAIAPLWAVLLADRFGRASFAKIMGSMMALIAPFTLVALPFSNMVFETTRSYIPAFTSLLIGYVVAIIALALFRLPTHRD